MTVRSHYADIQNRLRGERRSWLVTGAAGFIGSNLVEMLLRLGQDVTGLDNLATGFLRNLEEVRIAVGDAAWRRFRFVEADIVDMDACRAASAGVDHVVHLAALGSVPRSLTDPIASNAANVTGFLNMLVAARDEKVRSFIYAASSSTYGDEPNLPKIEERIGKPLSPYAVTKLVNELYADVFARSSGFGAIGLRYFNVFGPRQDPDGAYAAVIPRWTRLMIEGGEVVVNGDGETSRDFCYVDNAIQANLLASLAPPTRQNTVFNVAVGQSTSLNALFHKLRHKLALRQIPYAREPRHQEQRVGDIRHSLADIGKARSLLGYDPTHTLDAGLDVALPWYIRRFSAR